MCRAVQLSTHRRRLIIGLPLTPPKLNETGISFGRCFANRLLCRPCTFLPGGSGQWLMVA
jgi:hypothetical protein